MHREALRRGISRSVVALALLTSIGLPSVAGAAQGDCAQPLSSGAGPTASDCLFILGASVGLQTCNPACVCLPSGALPITATDALICLKAAVGQQVELACPCATTTTTVAPIPDVRGTYSGSLDVTTTQCTDPDDDDNFVMSGSMTISTQVGVEFEGSGIFTVRRSGIRFTLTVPVIGDVASNGALDGTYTETFVGQNGFSSSGFGTFSGSLSGNTLMLQLTGQDTDLFGVTCQVLAAFSGN